MAGPLTLILETSTPHASVAIAGADGVVEQHGFCSDRNHNSLLFEPLEGLLGGRADQVGLVLAGSGPGSYSGTRVGIAAAQGVAIALSCPAVAVPSILAVPSAADGNPCLAIGDARRGGFWSAGMENFRLTSDPELADAAGLEAVVRRAVEAGVPVVSFEEPGRFPLPAPLMQQMRQEFPDASRLWNAWHRTDEGTRQKWAEQPPQPLYLKPPHITPGRRAPLVHQR